MPPPRWHCSASTGRPRQLRCCGIRRRPLIISCGTKMFPATFSTPLFGLTPRRTTTYDLHRLLFEGDLHIGDRFRTFIQLSNHNVTSASLAPGTDVDQIDLQQGFVDLKTPVGQDTSLTFRGGRQEMEFGVGRLIDVREGPNIRQSWDSGRAFYQSPDLRLDAFLTKPFIPVPGFYPGGPISVPSRIRGQVFGVSMA
jgi:alginate export protein